MYVDTSCHEDAKTLVLKPRTRQSWYMYKQRNFYILDDIVDKSFGEEYDGYQRLIIRQKSWMHVLFVGYVKYSKTCLNRTPFGLKNLFSLDGFSLHWFKLHRHLLDGTVKSVWFRQVFGLEMFHCMPFLSSIFDQLMTS